MASEDAAVGMKLVDHDVPQVFEEARPTRVMGQHPAVQHVGVGQHDVGALSDGLASILRRISVVREGPNAALHAGKEALQPLKLIFGKRFRWKEVERAGLGVFRQRVQDRKVVAECLAARRRRGNDDVLAAGNLLPGFELMRIKLPDVSGREGRPQRRTHLGRNRATVRLASRLAPQRRDGRTRLLRPDFELFDRFLEGTILPRQRIARRRRIRIDKLKRKIHGRQVVLLLFALPV